MTLIISGLKIKLNKKISFIKN